MTSSFDLHHFATVNWIPMIGYDRSYDVFPYGADGLRV